ncbi:MAG: hypothetical protein M1817_003835 [Caeruleum heppii]|nr:MAG: hypothetical protein M1817_003835 [Caeruleum heppii]
MRIPSITCRRYEPDARIQKRPLMHPPIASPHSGASHPKVVYVSKSTPFISAVKRVRRLLGGIDKRSMGEVDLFSKAKDRAKIAQTGKGRGGEREEVLLKATAKAIEKALGLALYFQGQEDCRVRLRTGSVGAVDDILEIKPKGRPNDKEGNAGGGPNGDEHDEGGTTATLETKPQKSDDEELPETQIRHTSMIEVGISLR